MSLSKSGSIFDSLFLPFHLLSSIYDSATYNFWLGNSDSAISTPSLYKRVLQSDLIHKECKIFEVGIGTGIYYEFNSIASLVKSKKLLVRGVDINATYINDCKRRLSLKGLNDHVSCQCISLFDYKLDHKNNERYDVVLFMESAPVMPTQLIIDMIAYIHKNKFGGQTVSNGNEILDLKNTEKIVFVNNLTENSSYLFRFLKKHIYYIPFVNADFGNTLDRKFFLDIKETLKKDYGVNYKVEFEVLASERIRDCLKNILKPFPGSRLFIDTIYTVAEAIFGSGFNFEMTQYKIVFTNV